MTAGCSSGRSNSAIFLISAAAVALKLPRKLHGLPKAECERKFKLLYEMVDVIEPY